MTNDNWYWRYCSTFGAPNHMIINYDWNMMKVEPIFQGLCQSERCQHMIWYRRLTVPIEECTELSSLSIWYQINRACSWTLSRLWQCDPSQNMHVQTVQICADTTVPFGAWSLGRCMTSFTGLRTCKSSVPQDVNRQTRFIPRRN